MLSKAVIFTIYGAYLGSRFRLPWYFDYEVERLSVSCDLMIFWSSFCSMIHLQLDKGLPDSVGFYFMILAFPVVRKIALKFLQETDPVDSSTIKSIFTDEVECKRIFC